MKRFVKVLATTAVSFMAMQANAIQVTYTFRVNSSGPSIYPCNAGLLTENPYRGDKAICYTSDTHEACDPDCVGVDCKGNGNGKDGPNLPEPHFANLFNGGGHNPPPHTPPGPPRKNVCECTTEAGRENGNYIHATYVPWGQGADPHKDVISGQSPYFAHVFPGEVDAYKNVLQSLSFNLGSELYTAKYFVDICYRGSQIDYGTINTGWNILAETAVTDFGYAPSGEGYSKLADLEMKAYVICTTQNKTCEHGNCNDYDTQINSSEVAQYNTSFLQYLNQGKFNYSDKSDWEDAKGSFTQLIDNKNVDLGNHAAAKFCKIRYVYSETNGLDKNKAKHRKWQKHGANICTHTKVEMASMGNCTNCDHGHKGH
ncbi:hypothetical protein ACLVWU_04430 [Bdellovibrio sp. HCB290]|uniref:hypothetical protein n=1 Tax=Bdellovibrio sp. HCB290 TaxID=3394356 RepID=UPI0039B53DD9